MPEQQPTGEHNEAGQRLPNVTGELEAILATRNQGEASVQSSGEDSDPNEPEQHPYDEFDEPPSLDEFYAKLSQAFPDDDSVVDPQQVRQLRFEVATFVQENLDGYAYDYEPAQVWQAAVAFLERLRAKPAKGFGGDPDEINVADKLAESLKQTKLSQGNLTEYMNALHTLCRGGMSTWSASYGATEIIKRRHSVFKRLGDAEQLNQYSELLADPNVFGRLGNFFMNADESRIDYNRQERNEELLDDVLKGIGIDDLKGCLSAWTGTRLVDGTGKEKFQIETQGNLKRLAMLEEERPGSAKLLHGFYGIRGFERYPLKALVNQFDKHGDTSSAYGVFATALDDHNSAFIGARNNTGIISSAVKEEYDSRIIEAGSTAEFARRLSSLDKMYGDKHKISFVVLEAHGSPNSIFFGHTYDRNLDGLNMRHRLDHRSRHARADYQAQAERWFEDNLLVVLISCSTGEEAGIGQKISNEIHATVVAPEATAGVSGMGVSLKGGLHILPVYKNGDSMQGEEVVDVPAALYVDGEKIPTDDPRYRHYFQDLPAK